MKDSDTLSTMNLIDNTNLNEEKSNIDINNVDKYKDEDDNVVFSFKSKNAAKRLSSEYKIKNSSNIITKNNFNPKIRLKTDIINSPSQDNFKNLSPDKKTNFLSKFKSPTKLIPIHNNKRSLKINLLDQEARQELLIKELSLPANERVEENIFKLLSSFHLFENFMEYNGLNKTNIINCIPKMKLISYYKGETIFCQGDKSNMLFGIIKGEISLLVHKALSKEKIAELEAKKIIMKRNSTKNLTSNSENELKRGNELKLSGFSNYIKNKNYRDNQNNYEVFDNKSSDDSSSSIDNLGEMKDDDKANYNTSNKDFNENINHIIYENQENKFPVSNELLNKYEIISKDKDIIEINKTKSLFESPFDSKNSLIKKIIKKNKKKIGNRNENFEVIRKLEKSSSKKVSNLLTNSSIFNINSNKNIIEHDSKSSDYSNKNSNVTFNSNNSTKQLSLVDNDVKKMNDLKHLNRNTKNIRKNTKNNTVSITLNMNINKDTYTQTRNQSQNHSNYSINFDSIKNKANSVNKNNISSNLTSLTNINKNSLNSQDKNINITMPSRGSKRSTTLIQNKLLPTSLSSSKFPIENSNSLSHKAINNKNNSVNYNFKSNLKKISMFSNNNSNNLTKKSSQLIRSNIKAQSTIMFKKSVIMKENNDNLNSQRKSTTTKFKKDPSIKDSFPTEKYSTKEVLSIKEGQVFGEWGLIYNLNRSTSAVAKTDVYMFSIDSETFREFLSVDYERKELIKKRFPFLKNIPTIQFKKVFLNIINQSFKFDDIVYNQQDKALKLYYIYKGEVDLIHSRIINNKHFSKTVVKLKKGNIFGCEVFDYLIDSNKKTRIREIFKYLNNNSAINEANLKYYKYELEDLLLSIKKKQCNVIESNNESKVDNKETIKTTIDDNKNINTNEDNCNEDINKEKENEENSDSGDFYYDFTAKINSSTASIMKINFLEIDRFYQIGMLRSILQEVFDKEDRYSTIIKNSIIHHKRFKIDYYNDMISKRCKNHNNNKELNDMIDNFAKKSYNEVIKTNLNKKEVKKIDNITFDEFIKKSVIKKLNYKKNFSKNDSIAFNNLKSSVSLVNKITIPTYNSNYTLITNDNIKENNYVDANSSNKTYDFQNPSKKQRIKINDYISKSSNYNNINDTKESRGTLKLIHNQPQNIELIYNEEISSSSNINSNKEIVNSQNKDNNKNEALIRSNNKVIFKENHIKQALELTNKKESNSKQSILRDSSINNLNDKKNLNKENGESSNDNKLKANLSSINNNSNSTSVNKSSKFFVTTNTPTKKAENNGFLNYTDSSFKPKSNNISDKPSINSNSNNNTNINESLNNNSINYNQFDTRGTCKENTKKNSIFGLFDISTNVVKSKFSPYYENKSADNQKNLINSFTKSTNNHDIIAIFKENENVHKKINYNNYTERENNNYYINMKNKFIYTTEYMDKFDLDKNMANSQLDFLIQDKHKYESINSTESGDNQKLIKDKETKIINKDSYINIDDNSNSNANDIRAFNNNKNNEDLLLRQSSCSLVFKIKDYKEYLYNQDDENHEFTDNNDINNCKKKRSSIPIKLKPNIKDSILRNSTFRTNYKHKTTQFNLEDKKLFDSNSRKLLNNNGSSSINFSIKSKHCNVSNSLKENRNNDDYAIICETTKNEEDVTRKLSVTEINKENKVSNTYNKSFSKHLTNEFINENISKIYLSPFNSKKNLEVVNDNLINSSREANIHKHSFRNNSTITASDTVYDSIKSIIFSSTKNYYTNNQFKNNKENKIKIKDKNKKITSLHNSLKKLKKNFYTISSNKNFNSSSNISKNTTTFTSNNYNNMEKNNGLQNRYLYSEKNIELNLDTSLTSDNNNQSNSSIVQYKTDPVNVKKSKLKYISSYKRKSPAINNSIYNSSNNNNKNNNNFHSLSSGINCYNKKLVLHNNLFNNNYISNNKNIQDNSKKFSLEKNINYDNFREKTNRTIYTASTNNASNYANNSQRVSSQSLQNKIQNLKNSDCNSQDTNGNKSVKYFNTGDFNIALVSSLYNCNSKIK